MSEIVEEPTDVTEGPIVPHESGTVTLYYPIQHGERLIESLTFRPLTAKEMRRSAGTVMDMMSVKSQLDYAGFLSGETSQVIDKLQAADVIQVVGVISLFFGVSHGTGPG